MQFDDINVGFDIPIVLIMFNRPNETKIVLDSIRKIRPSKLFVISDGPRASYNDDESLSKMCRLHIEQIDWNCDVIKIYSDSNLGCMRNIVQGLNKVFEITDRAIILEDDCRPNLNFFKFMKWGLETFQNHGEIGMISGSNLIADKMSENFRNGFSIFINIWGWATWRSRWELHNSYVSIYDVNTNCNKLLKSKKFNFWQRMYWKELFKFTLLYNNTWDFQLQYSFFKNNLLSVYPNINLIENIGFSGNGTHTNIKSPNYIKNNIPSNNSDIMKFPENFSLIPILNRDFLLAKVIWKFNPYSAFKLKVKNIFVILGLFN